MRSIYIKPAGEDHQSPHRAVLEKVGFLGIVILLATLFVCPGPAMGAQGELEGDVTVGVENVEMDEKSAKHGEYTGIEEAGVYAIGQVDLVWSRDLYYFWLTGKNLGLDSREVDLTSGVYGGYKFNLGYDQTPHLISSDAKTIHDGVGSDDLTIPSTFKVGSQTDDMLDSLNAHARDIDLRVDRDTATASIVYPMGKMAFSLGYTQTAQKGERDFAGALGVHGGINRAVFLPIPIDYTTDDFTAALTFRGDNAMGRLEYFVSAFDNANQSVRWDSPFPTFVSGQRFPEEGVTALAPANTAQRVSVSGNVKLPYTTTLSALASFGTMEQDETLLPYSDNRATTLTTALPSETAGGKMEVTNYRLNLASKPAKDLRINAGLYHYGMENKAPRDLYIYIPMDTGMTQEGIDSGHALYRLPFDSQRTNYDINASYRIIDRTTVKAGWEMKSVERSYREAERTDENIYKASLNSAFDSGFASISYSTGSREIDGEYDEAVIYDNYHTEDYIAGVTEGIRFDDHPLLRKYDLANRDREKARAMFTLTPGENTTVGLSYSQGEDIYDESEFGLTSSESQSFTVDASYDAGGRLALFAYYTSETLKAEQASRSYRGHSKAREMNDEKRNWWAHHEDTIPTMGAGATFYLMDGAVDLTAHYAVSDAATAITFTAGESMEAVNLPDVTTKLTTFDLTARYRRSERLTIGLGYEYTDFIADDWATDDVDAMSDSIAQVLTMTDSIPDFTAHGALLFVTYSFGH